MTNFGHWLNVFKTFLVLLLSLNLKPSDGKVVNQSTIRRSLTPSRKLQAGSKTLNRNLGLSSSSIKVNGISVGFVPAAGEPIEPNTAAEINGILGTPMAVVGTYIELSVKDPNLGHLDYDLDQIKQLKGDPVWEIALMPVEGLESVTPEMANKVAKKMAYVNSAGVTVWLRFAHEMNGDWYAWGMKPGLFLEKWKLITNEVRKLAPSTYMLWAPNSEFGENRDSVHGGYTPYWPGGDFVDMIGLSFYHYGGFERLNVSPGPTEAVNMIKKFASYFGSPSHDRPIVLAETSAAYTRSVKTGEPAPGGASEKSLKIEWLKQLLSNRMTREVPELKAIVWFEVLKNESAAGNSQVKSEDFRLLTGPSKSLREEALSILTKKGNPMKSKQVFKNKNPTHQLASSKAQENSNNKKSHHHGKKNRNLKKKNLKKIKSNSEVHKVKTQKNKFYLSKKNRNKLTKSHRRKKKLSSSTKISSERKIQQLSKF